MIAIKTAIFVGLIALLSWAGINLAHAAVSAWPKWAIVEIGGAAGCFYGLTDLAYRWREWIGARGEYRPRRVASWGRWR